MRSGPLTRRLARAALPIALLASLAAAVLVLGRDSHADLENQSIFTSRAERLRMVVPRGWRATDAPTYPGLLLWMMRTQPPGQIVLSAEAFTRELYCAWPPQCRAAIDTPTAKYACALRTKLQEQRLRVGPVQAGPKENDAAGMPSVWFEYDDGKRFLRQAVAITSDRAVSLVLSAPSSEARSSHVRPFDQALRTLRPFAQGEAGGDASIVVAASDAGDTAADAAVADGAKVTAIFDGAAPTTPTFESAPAPKIDPVGPCPK